MLEGPLNARTALKWVAAGQQWIDSAPQTCTIDLSATTSIDSAGIAILLAWKRYAQQQHKKLCLIHLPAKLVSMLKLYELTEYF